MGGYSAQEVARMLGLTPARLRAYVKAGFLSPERGARGELRFSFQALVLLRTAEGLVTERMPPRRVRHALKKLRARLPRTDPGRPLSGLQLVTEGDHIVVDDGSARWRPDSGQVLLDFRDERATDKQAPALAPFKRQLPDAGVDGVDSSGAMRPLEKEESGSEVLGLTADDLYDIACELEETDPLHAQNTYLSVLALNPLHSDAHVNLGRLLHESGHPAEAEAHYRQALASRPADPTAAFNLGVALEDQGRNAEALESYERAVSLDGKNPDAHYNAARLYEKEGDYAAAVRHLRAYRQATKEQR
jgi:tetratricopeptide (TPR) repeat protein